MKNKKTVVVNGEEYEYTQKGSAYNPSKPFSIEVRIKNLRTGLIIKYNDNPWDLDLTPENIKNIILTGKR